ncbi:MAG: hypothetical protein Kow00121_11310 [Elainellaceae cyanobacterium]
MSELIITPGSGQPPGSGIQPEYGLQVISEQPVLLQRPPTTAPGTINAFGSAANDYIAALDPLDPTIYTMLGGDGADTLAGAAGNDVIAGEAGPDFLLGGAGDDILQGGFGDDTIDGGVGNDNLQGGDGNDVLVGAAGVDLLDGGAGNDILNGGPGDDVLLGGAGNDLIIGGPGDDRMQGGPGKDTLTGGPGRDTFRFERGSTGTTRRRQVRNEVDVVTDFNPVNDLIQLDRRLLRGQVRRGRLQAQDFEAVREFSDHTEARIIYERSTGLVYFNPNQGSPVILLQLDRNLNVTANDFEIFY